MNFEETYINFKEQEHIQPMELHNKKKYYTDLSNLEDSWTGRMDAKLANTFIHESVRLVINAIVLFEKGYIDCAYYSLRQSLEISTTMVYLTELDPDKKKEELNKWKSQSNFPMYSQMLRFLKNNGNAFSDIKLKMDKYFEKLQKVKKYMNKYVHKQGFNTFYIARNCISSRKDESSRVTKDFEGCLVSCIGAIAVFRLAIDPFPVLLMDYEIYSRTIDLVTEPYTHEFVEEYIGEEAFEAYKRTDIYQGYYEYLMNEEKRQLSVLDVTKNKHIDKEKIDEILNQAHLLTKTDFIAVAIAGLSEKVAKIYCFNGWPFYTTSTRSVRSDLSFHSGTLKNIRDSNNHLNVPYDEAFLTYLVVESESFFLEHNEKFELDEYKSLEVQISILLLMNSKNYEEQCETS
ncbi:hypothetical protein [Paenibacillus dendritiformis]|uniref:Uncharacterized protein n=1 Tax=Paenibacillus dendritiformis C454 TaxID=1131935 RepID=H3SNF5_9BACL|nr:hypothetical protein [Paenibacillus dendritiformis]EHQ59394.1 hypothetical protein PDENDC454_25526 [Paenibacillus dendritiformis C454]CAH8768632.1 hypothetical protein H7S4_001327 [Paenibacillus dendritiformis]